MPNDRYIADSGYTAQFLKKKFKRSLRHHKFVVQPSNSGEDSMA